MRTTIKSFIIATVALLLFQQNLYSETAYEKKCFQIYVKYYTLFQDGYSHGLSLADQIAFSLDPELFVRIAMYNALPNMSPERMEQYTKQMENELLLAETLMNPEEKAEQAENGRKKMLLETNPLNYLREVYGAEFAKWQMKGEFETTAEYEKRLENSSISVLNEICINKFPKSSFSVKPQKYNADNGVYLINVIYSIGGLYNDSLDVKINMDINTAKELSKSNLKIEDAVFGKINGKIVLQSATLLVDDKPYPVTTTASDIVFSGEMIAPTNRNIKQVSFNISALQRDIKIAQENAKNKRKMMIDELNDYNEKLKLAEKIVSTRDRPLQSNEIILLRRLGEYDIISNQGPESFELIYFNQKNDESIEKAYNKMKEIKEKYSWDNVSRYFTNKEEYNAVNQNGSYAVYLILLQKKQNAQLFKYYKQKVDEYRNHNFLCAYDDINPTFDEENFIITTLFNLLKDDSLYSEKVANTLIETNLKMNKEYTKNGSLFKSKIDFISAYFSEDYKKTVKAKKNSIK